MSEVSAYMYVGLLRLNLIITHEIRCADTAVWGGSSYYTSLRWVVLSPEIVHSDMLLIASSIATTHCHHLFLSVGFVCHYHQNHQISRSHLKTLDKGHKLDCSKNILYAWGLLKIVPMKIFISNQM